MRITVLAVCATLLAAGPAFAAAISLANGRTFSPPVSVPGCSAPVAKALANGSVNHQMTCSIAVDGKPKQATVYVTALQPNNTTTRGYFEILLKRLGKLEWLNDTHMGPRQRVIRTGGSTGTFLCFAYDDVASLSGGETCALEGEPSVRVTVLVSTTDAYSGVRIMDQVLKASVLR